MSRSLHQWYGRPALDAFAERRAVIGGEIELRRLARLNDLPHVDSGAGGDTVSASLRFQQRGEGWLILELEYRAELPLICQRCLETFMYPASARLRIGLLDAASMEPLLPRGCEPVVLEEDRLLPVQLIEDELIIALPLAPRHEPLAECGSLVHDNEMLSGAERGVSLKCAHDTTH